MSSRKQLIEEIGASFHALRNKMQAKVIQPGLKDCITHSQLFVLSIVEQNHDIGIKEISKKLGISSSATTQLVDGLVENNFVVRKTDAKDRRALQLELSPKGKKHISQMKKNYMKTMTFLFDTLSDRELETYLSLHKKILTSILEK